MTDELADLKNQMSQLRCLINTNANLSGQAIINLTEEFNTLLDLHEERVAERLDALKALLTTHIQGEGTDFGTSIQAQGERLDAAIDKTRTDTAEYVDAALERMSDQRKCFGEQLRKHFDDRADKTTAEIAALATCVDILEHPR